MAGSGVAAAAGLALRAPAEHRPPGRRIFGRLRRRALGTLVAELLDRVLEALDPRQQGVDVGAGFVVRELDQRHLGQDARVGRQAHLDHRRAEQLDRPHQHRRAEVARAHGDGVDLVGRQDHELGRHQRQERVAQVAHQCLGDRPRIAAHRHGVPHRRQCAARIALDQGEHELVEVDHVVDVAAGRDQQLERRQRVAGRAAALDDRGVERGLRQVEPGVVGNPAHVLGHRVGREEVELEVLRPRPDGVDHLLRVGGGEHEHDVRRRLLERLQQRRRRRLREHVHLVEDVHLVPTGRAERRPLDQVTDGVDAVVGRGVELVHVVGGATLDLQTRLALAARLAVDDVPAVQHLGEDAGGGRLAGAARPREQVRLALAALANRIAKCLDDMVLPLQLTESPRPVAAVEGLGRHRRQP